MPQTKYVLYDYSFLLQQWGGSWVVTTLFCCFAQGSRIATGITLSGPLGFCLQEYFYKLRVIMSDLITLRKKKRSKFYTVDLRVIESPELSWEAKGLWAYLISRPDGWSLNRNDLLARAKNGDSSLRSIIKELRTFGLLIIQRQRLEGGKWGKSSWIVSESMDDIQSSAENPHVDGPGVESPHVESPHVENPHVDGPHDLQCTSIQKTNVQITNKQTTNQKAVDDVANCKKSQNLIEQVRDSLENMGINPIRAEQLIINFGAEAVQKQIGWLPYRGNLNNPGGFLVKAIQGNYPAPPTVPEAVQKQDERLLKLRRIHSTRPEQRSYREQLEYGGMIANLIEAQAAKAPQTIFTLPDGSKATWLEYRHLICTFVFKAEDGTMLGLGAEELDQVNWAGKASQVQEVLSIYAAA